MTHQPQGLNPSEFLKPKCSKVSFANELFANKYIEKLKNTSTRRLKPVRSYLCENCLNWHLTSIEGTEVKRQIEYERQINNLKSKVIHLQNEVKILRLKLDKCVGAK